MTRVVTDPDQIHHTPHAHGGAQTDAAPHTAAVTATTKVRVGVVREAYVGLIARTASPTSSTVGSTRFGTVTRRCHSARPHATAEPRMIHMGSTHMDAMDSAVESRPRASHAARLRSRVISVHICSSPLMRFAA